MFIDSHMNWKKPISFVTNTLKTISFVLFSNHCIPTAVKFVVIHIKVIHILCFCCEKKVIHTVSY